MLDTLRWLQNKLFSRTSLEDKLQGLTRRQAERQLRAGGMSRSQAKRFVAEHRASFRTHE